MEKTTFYECIKVDRLWYNLHESAKNPEKERVITNHHRQVVVTGVGPVTPVGCGKEAYWESLICGKPAFKRVEFPGRDMDQYRCKVAAPIENFDLYQFVEQTKHSKYLGKTSRYAIAAAFLPPGMPAWMSKKMNLEKRTARGGAISAERA